LMPVMKPLCSSMPPSRLQENIKATICMHCIPPQVGTPHYMAPEMWRGQPYSYSAGGQALRCTADAWPSLAH
jgi:serine/threonine protein kinase